MDALSTKRCWLKNLAERVKEEEDILLRREKRSMTKRKY